MSHYFFCHFRYCTKIALLPKKGRTCYIVTFCINPDIRSLFCMFPNESAEKKKNVRGVFGYVEHLSFIEHLYFFVKIVNGFQSTIFPQKSSTVYVMLCAIWYNLYILKNVKNTPPQVFFTFLNCTNDTKSRNAYYVRLGYKYASVHFKIKNLKPQIFCKRKKHS